MSWGQAVQIFLQSKLIFLYKLLYSVGEKMANPKEISFFNRLLIRVLQNATKVEIDIW